MRRISLLCFLLLTACQGGRPGAESKPPRANDPGSQAPVGIWLAGDLHVHSDHSSDGSFLRQGLEQRGPGTVSVADQIGQALRAGLNWLPLTDHRSYDQHWDPLWSSDSLILIPGEEANGSPHCTVHGAIDTIVQGADFPDTPRLRVLQQSIWDAHAQNAIWISAHPDDGHTNDDGSPNDNASAQGVDLVETWNRASNPDAEIDYDESRWNAGFRFGVAGASDNHFRELWAIAGPGQPTTWVFAPVPTQRGIVEGLRAGRTSLSRDALGAFVQFSADADGDGVFEALGGDTVIAASGQTLRFRVELERGLGNQVLIYRAPGRSAGPLVEFRSNALNQTFDFEDEIGAAPSWYRVEIRGPGLIAGLGSPPNPLDQLQALASPIFVSTVPQRDAEPEIPLPPDAGAPDGARVALGAQGFFTGFGDVAVANGRSHFVAEIHGGGGTRILYRRQGELATQALSDSGFGRWPRIAALGDEVWVVWQDSAGQELPHRSRILLRHSRDGGASFASAVALSQGDGRAERPDIAVGSDAQPLVAWQDNRDDGAFDIWAISLGRDSEASNLSSTGKTVQAANLIDTRSSRYPASLQPAVSVARDGRSAVGWQDNRLDPNPLWTGETQLNPSQEAIETTNPDDWEIFVAIRDVDGGWTAPINVSSQAERAERNVSIQFLPDGELLTAWDSREMRAAGADLSIVSRTLGRDGTLGATQELGADIPGMGQRPSLGLSVGGLAQLVWMDSRSTDWRWRIFAADWLGDGYGSSRSASGPGNGSFPRLDSGVLLFTSDRLQAARQRDPTHHVMWRTLLSD